MMGGKQGIGFQLLNVKKILAKCYIVEWLSKCWDSKKD
jgi:hypothetical protein